MGVIARRLQDKEEDWRHVYKSLLLLEFMAKHGPQKVGWAAYHSGFCCWSLWPSLGPGQQYLLHATDAAAGGAFGQAWSLDGACLSHSGPLEVLYCPFSGAGCVVQVAASSVSLRCCCWSLGPRRCGVLQA